MTELATQELTEDEARALTDEIRGRVVDLLPLIKQAYEGRADRALGYDCWQDYCAGELEGLRVPLGDRSAMVAELRGAGMTQRAIGAALGVSQSTIRDDLAELSTSTQFPERAIGLDGKERPTTRQDPESTDPGPAVATPGGPDTDFGEVLDRLVPDHNPHREWQSRYLDAISGVHKLMRFTSDDVAERADEQCIDELIRVADLFAEYRLRVVNARVASMPDNVTPIRRIS